MHDGSSCWMPYLIRVLQLNHGTSGTGPSHFLLGLCAEVKLWGCGLHLRSGLWAMRFRLRAAGKITRLTLGR
ncbi:hypothetical protein QWZ13_17360 [Reinekea marina]|uniref:hypothetical protein n=1 Tax=Reinekea marina TaxID=1310421 RepID=UPI0025B4A80F|nr:hypothetical protein [Reinekea marina]MDN3650677.1 hypothetical protein [Reinekea marina]